MVKAVIGFMLSGILILSGTLIYAGFMCILGSGSENAGVIFTTVFGCGIVLFAIGLVLAIIDIIRDVW